MDIPTDFRRKMIIKLIEALRVSPSFGAISLAQLKEAVLNSEHQTFQQAKSMDEYVFYINEKLKKIKQSAPQRFEFKSDGKPEENHGVPRQDKEHGDTGSIINGNIPSHVKLKQMYSQEQALSSSGTKKKFDTFHASLNPNAARAMSVGKKPAKSTSNMFQAECHGSDMMQSGISSSCYAPSDHAYVRNDIGPKSMFPGSPGTQEDSSYRPSYGSPRPKDFVPFKSDYIPTMAGMPNKSPGPRGYSGQDLGYLREYYCEHPDPRYRGEFASQSPVARTGNLSSPGPRTDFGMGPGQRKAEFRRGYGCPSHYAAAHNDGAYSGPGSAEYAQSSASEYSKMPYHTRSPSMGKEGALPSDIRDGQGPKAFADRMKKGSGLDCATPNAQSSMASTPFHSSIQQPGHSMRHREAGLFREELEALDAYSSMQSARPESEVGRSASGMSMMYKDGKPMGNRHPPVEHGCHMSPHMSMPSASKSFVGNVNPSVMENGASKPYSIDPGSGASSKDRYSPNNFDVYQPAFSKPCDPMDAKLDVTRRAQKTEDEKREMMFNSLGKEFLKGKQPCSQASTECSVSIKESSIPMDGGSANNKDQKLSSPKQTLQSSDASEISSFLASDTALPFEPLRDSLDSDAEVPASLQSFLKNNNLSLKRIENKHAWRQLLGEALRKMEGTAVMTSRHGEIKSLLSKQREFLDYPFLDERDIEECSEYLSKGGGEVEYTQLIDRAIQAFTEKRKHDAGFVFNGNGDDKRSNK